MFTNYKCPDCHGNTSVPAVIHPTSRCSCCLPYCKNVALTQPPLTLQRKLGGPVLLLWEHQSDLRADGHGSEPEKKGAKGFVFF